jgi:hypothetical protein
MSESSKMIIIAFIGSYHYIDNKTLLMPRLGSSIAVPTELLPVGRQYLLLIKAILEF